MFYVEKLQLVNTYPGVPSRSILPTSNTSRNNSFQGLNPSFLSIAKVDVEWTATVTLARTLMKYKKNSQLVLKLNMIKIAKWIFCLILTTFEVSRIFWAPGSLANIALSLENQTAMLSLDCSNLLIQYFSTEMLSRVPSCTVWEIKNM